MGLFNTMNVAFACKACSWAGEVSVQFKYGNLYEHRYGLGSRINWGRTQVGRPEERRVAVEGIVQCPSCRADAFFDILIEAGVIQSVGLRSGRYDYHHGEGDYVVIQDGGV